MPNPKLGTVTDDIEGAVANLRKGQVQFRTERNKGMLHAGLGKVSFSDEKLLDNIRAFMLAISAAKPDGAKGKYMLSMHLSSTQGPGGIEVDVSSVDPASPRFMLTGR